MSAPSGIIRPVHAIIVVWAIWDDDPSVWVAGSDDVPGLIAEADTIERLRDHLVVTIPQLLPSQQRGVRPTGHPHSHHGRADQHFFPELLAGADKG